MALSLIVLRIQVRVLPTQTEPGGKGRHRRHFPGTVEVDGGVMITTKGSRHLLSTYQGLSIMPVLYLHYLIITTHFRGREVLLLTDEETNVQRRGAEVQPTSV